MELRICIIIAYTTTYDFAGASATFLGSSTRPARRVAIKVEFVMLHTIWNYALNLQFELLLLQLRNVTQIKGNVTLL